MLWRAGVDFSDAACLSINHTTTSPSANERRSVILTHYKGLLHEDEAKLNEEGAALSSPAVVVASDGAQQALLESKANANPISDDQMQYVDMQLTSSAEMQMLISNRTEATKKTKRPHPTTYEHR